MTARVRIAMALVTALALLVLGAGGPVRAADSTPQAVTRFLDADGTPLADDWRAAADTPVFVVIHGGLRPGPSAGRQHVGTASDDDPNRLQQTVYMIAAAR